MKNYQMTAKNCVEYKDNDGTGYLMGKGDKWLYIERVDRNGNCFENRMLVNSTWLEIFKQCMIDASYLRHAYKLALDERYGK